MKKIYRIWCEWEMPVANGTFETKEAAQKAIDDEDWDAVGYTKEEVIELGFVHIEEEPLR